MQGADLAVEGAEVTGQLQQTLVRHLEGCPHAIIVVEGINFARGDVLNPLLQALSEQVSLSIVLPMNVLATTRMQSVPMRRHLGMTVTPGIQGL